MDDPCREYPRRRVAPTRDPWIKRAVTAPTPRRPQAVTPPPRGLLSAPPSCRPPPDRSYRPTRRTAPADVPQHIHTQPHNFFLCVDSFWCGSKSFHAFPIHSPQSSSGVSGHFRPPPPFPPLKVWFSPAGKHTSPPCELSLAERVHSSTCTPPFPPPLLLSALLSSPTRIARAVFLRDIVIFNRRHSPFTTYKTRITEVCAQVVGSTQSQQEN